MSVPGYRELSLWHQTVPGSLDPRPPLNSGRTDREVDVAIVGAGFTGLWTAYYLLGADPSLRVAVLESQIAGFGASGRNGGWCSALFPVSAAALAREHGHDAAAAQYAAMRDSVSEVLRVAAVEDIDADIALGGTIMLARSEPQLERARTELADSERFGLGVTALDGPAARASLNATGVLAATYTPHCAAIHPAKLVRGLATAVQARGGRIYELTTATRIEPGLVSTDRGDLRAGVVVRATEGYTPRLAGLRRAIAPLYSLMIATEPLPQAVWDDIGLARRQTFSDYRHLLIYGQRTADDRLILGGKSAPYHFGSRIHPGFDRDPELFEILRRTALELFPVLAGKAITHGWGGPLGIARDWHASAGLENGVGWAGGYVGDGVATTNLAGRTLTDLVIGHSSELTTLPWVGHRSPDWEPEPLRWLATRAGTLAMKFADATEARTGRNSRVAAFLANRTGE